MLRLLPNKTGPARRGQEAQIDLLQQSTSQKGHSRSGIQAPSVGAIYLAKFPCLRNNLQTNTKSASYNLISSLRVLRYTM